MQIFHRHLTSSYFVVVLFEIQGDPSITILTYYVRTHVYNVRKSQVRKSKNHARRPATVTIYSRLSVVSLHPFLSRFPKKPTPPWILATTLLPFFLAISIPNCHPTSSPLAPW